MVYKNNIYNNLNMHLNCLILQMFETVISKVIIKKVCISKKFVKHMAIMIGVEILPTYNTLIIIFSVTCNTISSISKNMDKIS